MFHKLANLRKWHKQYYDYKYNEYYCHIYDSEISRAFSQTLKESSTMEYIEKLVFGVNNLKNFTLHEYQLDMFKMMIPTTLRYNEGEHRWNRNRQEILRENGYTRNYSDVIFVAPRRVGKTFTISLWIMLHITSVRKNPKGVYDVAVFATCQETSQKFITECVRNWNQLDPSITDEWKIKYSKKKIRLTHVDDDQHVCVVEAYASGGKVSTYERRERHCRETQWRGRGEHFSQFYSIGGGPNTKSDGIQIFGRVKLGSG